jgi:hypothetical protein
LEPGQAYPRPVRPQLSPDRPSPSPPMPQTCSVGLSSSLDEPHQAFFKEHQAFS